MRESRKFLCRQGQISSHWIRSAFRARRATRLGSLVRCATPRILSGISESLSYSTHLRVFRSFRSPSLSRSSPSTNSRTQAKFFPSRRRCLPSGGIILSQTARVRVHSLRSLMHHSVYLLIFSSQSNSPSVLASFLMYLATKPKSWHKNCHKCIAVTGRCLDLEGLPTANGAVFHFRIDITCVRSDSGSRESGTP